MEATEPRVDDGIVGKLLSSNRAKEESMVLGEILGDLPSLRPELEATGDGHRRRTCDTC